MISWNATNLHKFDTKIWCAITECDNQNVINGEIIYPVTQNNELSKLNYNICDMLLCFGLVSL